ncbi:hypothetical protein TSH7_06005 [Azospirillum sp. TSH7]|uniref:hypothetical protein n=1 Tax=unclassified Azospirillum TaxID=2630922 RepID=UPI000D61EC2A|nr:MULTISPECIES: hypothetical protein [unclassified Azospirillum]PWC66683.1 hypothetical protein TSH7_06005 [Azospirillum sp. TSH7]PWC70546.1 hypothetical protein TSH20_06450 [Azospirillum sp. TSH20]
MSVPDLKTIQSLAEVPDGALPINPGSIEVTPEGVLGIAKPPRPCKLTFMADGLPFNVAVRHESADEGGGSICQIWADVGHVPYTAQAPERRRALLAVLRGIEGLPHVRFIVQGGQKIILFSEIRLEHHASPEDLFHQTTLVLQEARPFLRLLGEYL